MRADDYDFVIRGGNVLDGTGAPGHELIALCRPLAARRLPYATRIRNEDDRLLDAIAAK